MVSKDGNQQRVEEIGSSFMNSHELSPASSFYLSADSSDMWLRKSLLVEDGTQNDILAF